MEAYRRTLGTAWLLAVPMLLRCIFVVISEKRKKKSELSKGRIGWRERCLSTWSSVPGVGLGSHLSLASRKAFANGLYLIFRAVI